MASFILRERKTIENLLGYRRRLNENGETIMKKIDRRIARTRKAVRDALVSLVKEQEFDRITVRDLTERADIGYATFYRHYKSKDELVTQVCLDVVLTAAAIFHADVENTDYDKSVALFKYLRMWKEVVLLGLSFPRDHPVVKPIWEAAFRLTEEVYMGRDELKIPLEVSINHVIQATAELIRWWLLEGQDYSAEQMAVMQSELVLKASVEAALEYRSQDSRPPLSLEAQDGS